MAKQELRISIAPDGTVHADVGGIKGTGCADLVKLLEDALGKASKKKIKPEYYEQEVRIAGTVTAED